MYVMGIDIGTTSISMVLIEASTGALLAQKTIVHEAGLPGKSPDEKLQDPERLWRLVKKHVKELSATHGRSAGIGLTGQMHGMLYVDGDGNALSPLYTWQDRQANHKLKNGKSSVELLNEQVGAVSPGYGIATHFYLQQTGRIPENAKKMTTISDYIAMKLCDRTQPVIGADMAASWGCFDLKKREFLYDALENAGVELSYLPPAETGHTLAGTTEDDIPVMVSIGDNQASLFGSVRSLSDTVLINVGTGSQVSFVTKNFASCKGSIELRPCTEESYLLAGSSLCGGRAYAMLEQFYREISGAQTSCYDKMLEQAQRFLDAYGTDAAWQIRTTFSGTRNNPKEQGQMTGIRPENFHPGAMTAGMIMGIIRELYEQYEAMCKITGKRAAHLVGSGNGLRKNPLMQKLAAEMFCMKLQIPAHAEEAAYGAALCALALTGQDSLEKVQQKIRYLT